MHPGPPLEPARAAGNILNAIRRGSLVELELELGRAVLLAGSAPPEERAELVAAIAAHIRASIARCHRRQHRPLESCAAHLGLLHHLACD